MDLLVTPKKPAGKLAVISSKSMAHRLLIAAALADRETRVAINGVCEDVEATVSCLRALGAGIGENAQGFTVSPIESPPKFARLDCRESGSTLRFLLPVAAALCEEFEITGGGRLPERPNGPLLEALAQNGVTFHCETLPIRAEGRLRAGQFAVRGDISSQYLTGLLLAMPLLSGESTLTLTTPLESADYVEMTLGAMRTFGVSVLREGDTYYVEKNARYCSPGHVRVEGDYSAAAFFCAANFLGANVAVEGLAPDSLQGDRKFCEVLKTLAPGAVIDGSDIPDLIPALAVCACAVKGKIRIEKIGRLRFKESDRIESVAQMIRSLGGEVIAGADFLEIRGTGSLAGGAVESFGDHRIVMSAAAAACICRSPVVIRGAEAVKKSYPDFFTKWNELGGEAHVIDVRQ